MQVLQEGVLGRGPPPPPPAVPGTSRRSSTPSCPPPGPRPDYGGDAGRGSDGCRTGRRSGPVGLSYGPAEAIQGRTRPGSVTSPNWGQVAQARCRNISKGRARMCPRHPPSQQSIRGESQATQCRQNLRLVERHRTSGGSRVSREHLCCHPRPIPGCAQSARTSDSGSSDLRVRTGSGVSIRPNQQPVMRSGVAPLR